MRVPIAAQIYSKLVAIEYQAMGQAFREHVDVYGKDSIPEDGLPVGLELGRPAAIAVMAADRLLVALGLLEIHNHPPEE